MPSTDTYLFPMTKLAKSHSLDSGVGTQTSGLWQITMHVSLTACFFLHEWTKSKSL